MKQKFKYLFFHQTRPYALVVLLAFSGCGLPKDTKEDIDIISEKAESIDRSMQQIAEVAENKGVLVIIKNSYFDELSQEVKELAEKLNEILNVDEEEDVADELSDYGIDNIDDVFNDEEDDEEDDEEEIKSILQDFKMRLTEALEKLEAEDENRHNVESLIEQITQLLENRQ